MSETVGSQRLLQRAVVEAERVLDPAVRSALGAPDQTSVRWVSPTPADAYREYRDGQALDRLGLARLRPHLADFWPARGPVWDGLAIFDSGQVLLVEAKAHIPELASPGTRAKDASLAKIREAFAMVRAEIAPNSSADWTGTFYQYANRLAFLYFLRKHGVDAHLAHVLFINATDVAGPADPAEWHGALQLLRSALGLDQHRLKMFVHEIVLDAATLPPSDLQLVV